MDYFFWQFDAQCKENKIQVDWFFPNSATHGAYSTLTILESQGLNVENFFLEACENKGLFYSHIITHFIELCTPFYYKLNKMSNAKIIAVDHNPRPLNGYPLKKRIEKKVKGILFSRHIDLFVGVSNAAKKDLLVDFGRHIKIKTIVVFNGINSNQFLQKKDYFSNNKFIIASHLRKDKGVQDVIEAIKNLGHLDFMIDIYGEGNYEASLREMVGKYSLEKRITFKGSVANLYRIYHKYDYLIHPSHGETFCYTVVESLFCNVPVITTRHQGNVLGLVIENKNGFLFDEVDISALTSILKKIITKKIGIDNFYNISTLANFSLENMVQNHLQLVL
jgi:glycosyltransferase involved in cell wall biosynthesis